MAHVTTVVFDMGNVLLRWTPFEFAWNYAATEGEARAVADSIFDSAEWPLVDAGALSERTMLAIAKTRLPERLHPVLEETYANYHNLQRRIWATNRLAFALHRAGARLCILSNVGQRFRYLGPRIPIFGLTDGIVISAFERVMKPDPAIYEIFCKRFGLAPETCVFVDDSAKNLIGAREVGMRTVHFTGDVEALRRELAELGVPGAASYRAPRDADEPFDIGDAVRARIPEVLDRLIAEGGARVEDDPRPGPGEEPLWADLYRP